MKIVSLLITLIFISTNLWGQELQDGGYKNHNELEKNTPSFKDVFKVVKRTKRDIKAWGGSDYKIESTNSSVTKKEIKKEIWGIVKNDTLYLNGIPIDGLIWYAKVEIFGKYCFLRPAFPINRKIQKELGLNSPQYGYTYGAIGGAIQGAKIAVKRIPLIYNIETGKKMLLNQSNILKILQNYPHLRAEFEKEVNKTNEKILLDYLKKIDESGKIIIGANKGS